ncbi:MAG: A/G-specific adenine glycosylase [Bacteroidota bacterium]|nr:A/G-specific adenine glycosylase [Bacteroidota bacterium]
MESWFTKKLTNWYKINKRDLPWRHETNPYFIWLSEIILQQTQVVQGLSYYTKFITHYPTVKKLANASEDEILKDWQGLGYYSRARNLQAAAKHILEKHKGIFPDKYEDIRALKGIGDYTAAAIASFAYNLPYAVVDGNVYRVLSRLFGIETPIDSGDGKKQFQKLANELLDKKNPAIHNQAIMEFGSQYCKPVNPSCENCIFNKKCFAFANNVVSQLPLKEKKTKIKNRYFNYLILIDKNKNIVLNKRSENDIWKGLYEFYLLETDKEISESELKTQKLIKSELPTNFSILYVSKQYKHILSHQHLYAKFYIIKLLNSHSKKVITSSIKSLTNYAFPRLIDKFLNDCNEELFS